MISLTKGNLIFAAIVAAIVLAIIGELRYQYLRAQSQNTTAETFRTHNTDDNPPATQQPIPHHEKSIHDGTQGNLKWFGPSNANFVELAQTDVLY